jgi:hypothetical protein
MESPKLLILASLASVWRFDALIPDGHYQATQSQQFRRFADHPYKIGFTLS